MSFGFDPSIPLLALRGSERSPLEPLQTLASIGAQRTQTAHATATLADLLQRQGQERTLADIYRANAETPEALPSALFGGGFGAQGLKALDTVRELREVHLKHVGGLFSGVDTPEKYAAAKQLLASNPDRMLSVYAAHLPEQFNPAVADRLAALSPRAAKVPLTDEERDARAARAELERAKAAALGRGPAIDPVKQETQKLKNDKLKKELGGGGPNKLTALDGYDQDPEFQVKPEVADKLRTAQAQTRTMTKNVDELMTLYREYGNKVLPSAARARMEAIARHLQLKAKGETMFQLGVIAGPDMDLLNSVIPVPTKRQATIADFFSGGGDSSETMERLRVMREQLGENFHAAVTSRGYKRKGNAAKSASGNAALSDEERKELEALKADLEL